MTERSETVKGELEAARAQLDEKRAEAAKERAEAAISSAKDARSIELAKAKLARALNRINVAGMK